MFSFRCKPLLLWLSFATITTAACGDPDFRFGENITGIQFEFFDENEGVFPSTVVLQNPRNPFRHHPIGSETKWAILGSGGNAGAFYAWATLLAREATGEHQFYTATKLRDIYNAREVQGDDLELVREMAIAAFQAVLDDFPDSVTFDFTGTRTSRLATPAYLEILGLDGAPQGDWVLVLDEDGNPVAIKGAGVDVDRPEPAEDEE